MKCAKVLKSASVVGCALLAISETESAYEETWISLLDDDRVHVSQLSYYISQLPDVLLTDCKYRSKSSPDKKNYQAESWAK